MTVTRLAASRVGSSEASDHGASARFAPLIAENAGAGWRLGAAANGPRRARALVRQVGTDRRHGWAFEERDSASTPEIVVRALTDGVVRLRAIGANDVTIVVLNRTLSGYLFLSWQVHSLAMHAALERLLEASSGLRVSFEPPKQRGNQVSSE
jgi:hypothetical protein